MTEIVQKITEIIEKAKVLGAGAWSFLSEQNIFIIIGLSIFSFIQTLLLPLFVYLIFNRHHKRRFSIKDFFVFYFHFWFIAILYVVIIPLVLILIPLLLSHLGWLHFFGVF